MFGLFGRSKYLRTVYSKTRFFIGQAGIERSNAVFEKIKREVELNQGEHWDERVSFHDFIAEQIDEVVWQKRSYIYEQAKFTENQAAIYCISEYISNLGESGVLREMQHEQKDMCDALRKLWSFLLELGSDSGTRQNYAHVLVSGKAFEEFLS